MSEDSAKLLPSNGISGGYRGHDRQILHAMTAFSAIAWYNAAEILTLVLLIFKKYSGLYFWAVLASAASILPYQAGAYAKQNNVAPKLQLLHVCTSTLGWIIMVPGQSIVLYSRLHLVTQNERLLKFILRLIIFNAIILCVPTAIMTFGSNSSNSNAFTKPYAIYEKVQLMIFTLQELFISSVYLVEVRRILMVVMEGGTRKLLMQVVVINLIIMLMDVALVAVGFADYYQIEVTLKGMVYSIKLKLEFGVLSKLVDVVTDRTTRHRVAPQAVDRMDIYLEDVESLPSEKSRKASGQRMKPIHDMRPGDDNIMYPDWRIDSEPSARPVPPHLLDEIIHFKEAKVTSRRCSISEMYPGRLYPLSDERLHIETIEMTEHPQNQANPPTHGKDGDRKT